MDLDDFLAAPEIVRRLISQDAPENETVTFTCTVQNADEDEPYTIGWFFNDQQLQSNEEKYSVEENAKTGICLLTIRQITPDDEGAYRCVATNKFGSAVSTGFLAVLSKSQSFDNVPLIDSGDFLGRKRSQSPSPSRNASPSRSLSPSGNRSRDRSASPLRYINLPMSKLARVTEELEHLIHPTAVTVHEEEEETVEVLPAPVVTEEPTLAPEESIVIPQITTPDLPAENVPLSDIPTEVSRERSADSIRRKQVADGHFSSMNNRIISYCSHCVGGCHSCPISSRQK